MKKAANNKNLTSFAEHLDSQYGERGSESREKYEQEFEVFKLGVMQNDVIYNSSYLKSIYHMKKYILFIISVLIFTACHTGNQKTDNENNMENEQPTPAGITLHKDDVMSSISLTVAESKRLIAKGIAIHPLVKRKLESGMIIITTGTTNTYIAQELMGLKAPHGNFVTGNITPKKGNPLKAEGAKVPVVVMVDGQQVDMSLQDALAAVKEGDIVFKGGNLLNYEKKQAAVTIGAPDGGTTARIQPYTSEGPAHLIVPIGLEKEVFGDLRDYERILSQEVKKESFVPKIAVHKNAEIFTEIEAIKLFGKVNIVPFAAGGIAGSEGGKSFAVFGPLQEVKKVLAMVAEIQGEPPFVNY